MGVSFGGKLALMYMDRYPESINRVVLHAPDGPNIDHVSKRGRYSQRALDKLFEYCTSDSLCSATYPNIKQEFQELMTRMKTEEVKQEIIMDDTTHQIIMTWSPVAYKLQSMFYQDNDYIQIPYIVHEAYLENYMPLLDAMQINNTDTNYFLAYGMWLSNICAEDIPLASSNYSDAEKETFLSDYIYQTRKNACDQWPVDPGEDSTFQRIVSDIPTLLISGDFDPTLPPETGVEIVSSLSNSQHIVIPYMGHIFADLSNIDCYDNYIVAFFDEKQDDLQLDCFNEMKPQPFKLTPKKD